MLNYNFCSRFETNNYDFELVLFWLQFMVKLVGGGTIKRGSCPTRSLLLGYCRKTCTKFVWFDKDWKPRKNTTSFIRKINIVFI